ncbi:MAG: hypothetical protein IPK90_10205 [Chitinophagaceae bacterium]|nr:hypothetical protein [Chitinophagaceae bacterium]
MLQKGKNILVITYWDFNEAHVQANVLPNLKFLSQAAGDCSNIYLFCLNKKQLSKQEIAQAEKILSPFKIRLIWFNYSHFGIKMILKFTWLIPFLCYTVWIKKIKQVFAWCTTAGAIGYIVSVMTRRPLILESYEPHAESMVENGHWSKSHLAYQVLSWFEKKQAQRATYIIAANGGMRDYVKKRYDYLILEEKFFVKPACVDLNEFYPDASKREAIRKEIAIQE